MATVTRSGRKLKDEDSNSLRGKHNGNKASVTPGSTSIDNSSLRRSTRETSLKKSTPSNCRKSVRLKKRVQLPEVKRKSERVEKQKLPSPVRKSDRVERNRSSASAGSSKPHKDLNSVDEKTKNSKKDKNKKQVEVEFGVKSKNKKRDRRALNLTSKQNRLDSRGYRASFGSEETEVQESGHIKKLCNANSDSGCDADSKEIEGDQDNCSVRKEEFAKRMQAGEGCGRSIEDSSSGSKKNSGGTLGKSGVKHKNDFEKAYESSNEDSSRVSNCSGSSLHSHHGGVTPEETVKVAEAVELYSSTEEDLQKPEMMKSTLKDRSFSSDPDISATETCEETSNSTANAVPTSPRGSKRSDSLDRCTSCSKRQRVDLASKKCKACSCEHMKYTNLCAISTIKESYKQVPNSRDSHSGEVPVNLDASKADSGCIDAQRGENVDFCAGKLVTGAQRNFILDGTKCHTIIDHLAPFEADEVEVQAPRSTEEHCSTMQMQLKESPLKIQTDSIHYACGICNLDGNLLKTCDGNGCKRSYHFYCLDPPLEDFPGGWHCPWCVKKKIELGVHTVSGGVESIWDVREMEAPNSEGMQKQKKYLVKYQGLAHIHNCWMPEDQLRLEAPSLFTNFIKNQNVIRWKSEWTRPIRLLKRRLLMSLKQHDDDLVSCCDDNLDCKYEWLVKWSGLGYEHVTWELETASFLRSPEAAILIKEYEDRLENARITSHPFRVDKLLQERKCSFSKLLELSGRGLSGLSNDYLSFVNKLRECWHKYRNAVVIEEQEQILKMVLFILSLQPHICRPFLIISTSSVISAWEADFARLAPSVNVVVYNGDKSVREYIRKLEFYEEGGCILFQVLLAPLDAVIEDLEAFECIGWEIIIVDEAQNSRISIQLEQINLLTTELKMLLVTGPIKDIINDYINLLSFIDSKGDGKSADNIKMSFASNISLVKERFNGFVVSERKSDTSKFVEYWVPVCLSNIQLEQYCATLLSNSISLRSCSKNDPVGALRNILISARKTCDHPYLVDQSLQSLLTEGLPPVEFLDVGVNASGKLQLLDKILSEIRKRDMRALILFQPIRGDGRNPIGDILDDFLRQRFGKDSYERVDSGLALSKKQVAMNMFNKKERGRFVFLIENRACLSSIKLSSVDIVILFDSDWNPLNDIKALQKISISSQFEELKVFRLFSSFTVEENVLILAKQNVTLDSNLENINCNTSHLLLTWGASYLFKRLDEFHGSYTSSSGSHLALKQSSVESVLHELLNELPNSENRNMRKCSIILKVFQGGSSYSGDVNLPGEMEMHSRSEELPHIFWTSLLEGRSPKWRYSSGPSPRVRRKVQYFDDIAKKSKGDNDEVSRKRKKVMTNASEPMSPKSGLNDKKKVVSIEREVTSRSPTAIESQDLSKPTTNSKCVNHSMSDISEMPAVHMVESEEKRNLRDLQKNLHVSLKPEILKLCDILQLPGVVNDMAGRFLEYIMNNNHVNREPVTIFQAFQISVCWSAASLLKHKIIRRDSLALAKQHLNFECKEEEAYLIYTKMRMLKKTFAKEVNKAIEPDFIHDPTRSKIEKSHLHVHVSQSNLSDEQELEEGEIRESDREPNSPSQTVSRKQEQSSESDKATVSSINDFIVGITQVKKIYRKRLRRLDHKQMEEYEEFKKVREKATAELEKKQKLESALIRTIHSSQASVRLDKLRMVAQEFSRKMDKLNNHMETQEKSLKAMHLAARNEEELLMAHWLKEAKSGRPVDAFAEIPLSNSGFSMELLEDGNHIQVDAHQTSTRRSDDPSSESRDPDSTVPVEAIPVDPPVVRAYVLESGICSELSTVAIESAGGNDETDTFATMATVEAEQADVQNELLTVAIEAAGGNDETDTTATTATVEAEQADVHNELPTVATGSGGESDKIVATATMVPVEAEQGSICNELPTLATESYRGNDEIDTMVEENENVVAAQPCDRIGASDCCNSSPSMNQIQMASPLAHNDVTPAQDGEIASPQEPVLGNLQPSGSSSGLATEDVTSHNKKNSSQLVEDPPVQPSDAVPSGQCNMGSLVPSSGLELPLPLPLHTSSLDRQPELLACTHALIEINQSNGGDASIQQVEVITATQSSEEQNEQLNGSHLQPDIPLPSTILSSLQIEVPTQLPAILQNAPVDHSLLQPVLQLQRPAHVDTALGGNGANVSHSSRGTDFLADSIRRHPLAAPIASRMPQILHPDPLQNELDRISKEIKHVKEMHDEVKSRLTASCEKEIEEIRKKYNALIEDAENAHAEKKNLLEANYSKVDMNRRLARAFRIKCSDSKAMGAALALQQGAHQSLMRPRYQNPLWQQTQRVPAPAPSTSALSSQPPVQVVQHSSALFSSNSIRSHVSPPVVCPPIGNRHVGSELRAPAPHLQPFRPSSITAISLSPLTNMVPPQQSLSNSVNCSILPHPVPLHPVIPSSGAFNRMLPQPESGVAVSNFHNCHQSAIELLTNVSNTSGNLPNILPSFQGLTSDTVANMSQMAVAGGGLRSTTASAGSTSDVVCLSDDDDE